MSLGDRIIAAMTNLGTDKYRRVYDSTTGDIVYYIKSGDTWFKIDQLLGQKINDDFSSVFDISALGINCIISNYPYSVAKVGAGTILANVGSSVGMRITTGATLNNSVIIQDGDNTGIKRVWNVAQEPCLHLHYRFPGVADDDDVYFLGCFYEDADNYIGIRYDTAVDQNVRLVTRADAAETLTVLGGLDTNWYEMYACLTATSVKFSQDEANAIEHTTNIPDGNLAWRTELKTLTNAAKNYDVAHLIVVQNEV